MDVGAGVCRRPRSRFSGAHLPCLPACLQGHKTPAALRQREVQRPQFTPSRANPPPCAWSSKCSGGVAAAGDSLACPPGHRQGTMGTLRRSAGLALFTSALQKRLAGAPWCPLEGVPAPEVQDAPAPAPGRTDQAKQGRPLPVSWLSMQRAVRRGPGGRVTQRAQLRPPASACLPGSQAWPWHHPRGAWHRPPASSLLRCPHPALAPGVSGFLGRPGLRARSLCPGGRVAEGRGMDSGIRLKLITPEEPPPLEPGLVISLGCGIICSAVQLGSRLIRLDLGYVAVPGLPSVLGGT